MMTTRQPLRYLRSLVQRLRPWMTSTQKPPRADSLARLLQCYMLGKGEMAIAQLHAERLYRRTHPEVVEYFRAAIAAGNSSDINFAGPLASYRAMVGEVIALLGNDWIGAQIPGRRVPTKVRTAVETSRPRTSWRGPTTSHPKPMSIGGFVTVQHEIRTASSAIVLTEESLDFSGSAASLLRSLERAVVDGLDTAFLNPAYVASADAPTSITANAPQITPTGSTAAAVKNDLASMAVRVASAADGMLEWPEVIASPLSIVKLALMPDDEGGPAFPTAALRNGSLPGMPLLASNGATTDDSPTTDYLVMVDAAQLLISGIEDVRFSIAREASVILDDAPSPGAQAMINLWQNNMVGLRAEVVANWSLARPNAAASLRVTF